MTTVNKNKDIIIHESCRICVFLVSIIQLTLIFHKQFKCNQIISDLAFHNFNKMQISENCHLFATYPTLLLCMFKKKTCLKLWSFQLGNITLAALKCKHK